MSRRINPAAESDIMFYVYVQNHDSVSLINRK